MTLTNEQKFVVKPLCSWFKKQKANWKLRTPRFGTGEKGWDIEASRKNQNLLIEAKFIQGKFLNSFGGLTTSPLPFRKQNSIKRKYRSWCHSACWAIGIPKPPRETYQILFDYLIRNFQFWKHYEKDFHLKFVYFVYQGKVTKVPFKDLLALAKQYERGSDAAKLPQTGGQTKKRELAEKLMAKYKFS